MSATCLTVLSPGLCTLVVDGGRPSYRSLGVSVGGAADRRALSLGNALVGNAPDAAGLEISLAGPTLRANCDLGCVLFGAPFDIVSDRQALRAGKTFNLRDGETLHIGSTPTGMRAYFCVRGGLQTPLLLGSRSGLSPLQAGMQLPCQAGSITTRSLGSALGHEELGLVHTLPGPQSDWFSAGEFEATAYTVTPASNRMGIRLQGRVLAVPSRELVSEPVCPGAVQVTRDGQCIVLGVDGQTIGGYPKIAQVITADLDLLAQLRPGATLRFNTVTLAEAEERYRSHRARLRDLLVRLRTTEGLLS